MEEFFESKNYQSAYFKLVPKFFFRMYERKSVYDIIKEH